MNTKGWRGPQPRSPRGAVSSCGQRAETHAKRIPVLGRKGLREPGSGPTSQASPTSDLPQGCLGEGWLLTSAARPYALWVLCRCSSFLHRSHHPTPHTPTLCGVYVRVEEAELTTYRAPPQQPRPLAQPLGQTQARFEHCTPACWSVLTCAVVGVGRGRGFLVALGQQ
jgi:hypothetical protein